MKPSTEKRCEPSVYFELQKKQFDGIFAKIQSNFLMKKKLIEKGNIKFAFIKQQLSGFISQKALIRGDQTEIEKLFFDACEQISKKARLLFLPHNKRILSIIVNYYLLISSLFYNIYVFSKKANQTRRVHQKIKITFNLFTRDSHISEKDEINNLKSFEDGRY